MKVSLINQSDQSSILLANQQMTVIGRGVFGIDDKRISKHHGEISVNDYQIKIKACHKNPIYYKKGNDDLKILDQNNEIDLNNNDKFSLVPDNFEFQVKIEDNANGDAAAVRVRDVAAINNQPTVAIKQEGNGSAQQQVTSTSSTSPAQKRPASESENGQPKKIKTEPQDPTDNAASTSSTNPPQQANPDSTNPPQKVKQEPADSSDNNQPAQCQPNARASCDHGIRCFRNSTEHRRDLAHPGDNDYRRPDYPQAPANAPRCPYWEGCYRRNPDHFRMFEHPPASVYDPNARPQIPAPQLPAARRLVAVNVNFLNDDDDEDEDDDMFDDDDDSDMDPNADFDDDEEEEDGESAEEENNLEE